MTDPSRVCTECAGTGFRIQAGEDGTRARECGCRGEDRRDHLWQAACIPRRYRHCTLENFDRMNPSQERARAVADQYVREFPGRRLGLLFLGPCGVGKTHLAVSVLQALIRTKGVPGRFYDYRDLLKEIQSTFRPDAGMSEMGVLAPVFAAELLVLDDVGARQPSAWVEETLSHIISHRYNEQRVTILTSNYPDVPGPNGEPTLEERLGTRIRSRLYEMCKVIAVEGEDYRRISRQAGYHF